MDTSAESAFSAARLICRRDNRPLFLLLQLLPKSKRDALFAITAFRRSVPDALGQPDTTEPADSLPTTVGVACCSSNTLDATHTLLRRRIDQLYDGSLELPRPEFRDEGQHALHALALTIHRYQIPKSSLLEFADGCRADLSTRRYATWTALERHCHHVAGSIALMTTCILGLMSGDARPQAVQLATAIRLTEILANLKRDWTRGRLYLPLEDLARFKYTERDLASGIVNEPFRNVMRFQIARARDLFRRGAQGLCQLPPDGSRFVAATFALRASATLRAIERQDFDVFSTAPNVTTAQKLRLPAAAFRLARRQPAEPIPDVFS